MVTGFRYALCQVAADLAFSQRSGQPVGHVSRDLANPLLGMSRGAPEGGAVVLDVAQLEALLTGTFSIGLDVGRGREKVALVRLRLSRALPGAAGTQAMAAEALAIERVATEQIAAAGGLALHAAAFNGMPDPVLHLACHGRTARPGPA